MCAHTYTHTLVAASRLPAAAAAYVAFALAMPLHALTGTTKQVSGYPLNKCVHPLPIHDRSGWIAAIYRRSIP